MTSTTMTRPAALVCSLSRHSAAKKTAVSKPKGITVPSRSLPMVVGDGLLVLGTAMTRTPFFCSIGAIQGIDVVHSKQPHQRIGAIAFTAAAAFSRHREREGIAAVGRADDCPSLMLLMREPSHRIGGQVKKTRAPTPADVDARHRASAGGRTQCSVLSSASRADRESGGRFRNRPYPRHA
jgi:hypothetical protein